MGSKIIGIEYVFPQNRISNETLALEFPDYDFAQFESKVGIKNRYVVNEKQTGLDLAVQACEKLFERFEKSTIDYILYCTQSPEYFLPTTACILQDRLKLNKMTAAFDYNLGCSGYTYGLSLANAIIKSGQAVNVLLVTAETYSKFIHPKDRTNRAIFGDAATATLITRSADNEIGEFIFGTDGSGYDKLIVKNGAARNNKDPEAVDFIYGSDNTTSDNNLFMNGPEVFNFTVNLIPNLTKQILEKNGITVENIDQYIFHQANAFMLNFMRKQLQVERKYFFIDLLDGGNTVSSTIPIALKKYSLAISNSQQTIMLVGFGVGLSWCGGVIKLKHKL